MEPYSVASVSSSPQTWYVLYWPSWESAALVWGTGRHTADPWARELGKLMLGNRKCQRAGFSVKFGPAVVYSEGEATLKVCVKTFWVQQHCAPGRFVRGEGFYSISPFLVVTQLSRPRYIFLKLLGKYKMNHEPHKFLELLAFTCCYFFRNNKDPREGKLTMGNLDVKFTAWSCGPCFSLLFLCLFFPPLQWKQLIYWISGRNTARAAAANSVRANSGFQHWSSAAPAPHEPLFGALFLLGERERAGVWAAHEWERVARPPLVSPRVPGWIAARSAPR